MNRVSKKDDRLLLVLASEVEAQRTPRAETCRGDYSVERQLCPHQRRAVLSRMSPAIATGKAALLITGMPAYLSLAVVGLSGGHYIEAP